MFIKFACALINIKLLYSPSHWAKYDVLNPWPLNDASALNLIQSLFPDDAIDCEINEPQNLSFKGTYSSSPSLISK